MTKTKKLYLNKINKIILSISVLNIAACLIYGVLNIYFSNNGYSPQIVSDAFSKICIPVYISLLFIVCSSIIGLFIAEPHNKHKFYKIKNFKQNQPPKLTSRTMIIIKITIIVLGIISLVFGAIFGGFNDVLTKAVNICTECIGLG